MSEEGNLPVEVKGNTYLDNSIDDESFSKILQVTTGLLRDAIAAVPESMKGLSDKEFCQLFSFYPTRQDRSMRVNFWKQYDYVMSGKKSWISIDSIVYGSYSSRQTFYSSVVNDVKRIAYMLIPNPPYHAVLELMMVKGQERIWEILDLPIKEVIERKTKKGIKIETKYYPQHAKLMIEIVGDIASRLKGLPVQRIEEKKMTVNVKDYTNLKDLDEKIKKMEKELGLKKADDILEITAGKVEDDE